MHIPGKRLNRNIRRMSRHYWTRARITKAAAEAQKVGNKMEAMRLAALIGVTEPMARSNQRQRRKSRRQSFASGNKKAFS